MEKPTIGTQTTFIEHWAIVTDKDNYSEYPVAVAVGYDRVDFKDLVERIALKRAAEYLAGNAGEAEYQGTTGATYIGEWTGKRWQKLKNEAPATVDISLHFKLS